MAMIEFLQVIVVLVIIGIWAWLIGAVVNFIIEVPNQLKRIADALEKEV